MKVDFDVWAIEDPNCLLLRAHHMNEQHVPVELDKRHWHKFHINRDTRSKDPRNQSFLEVPKRILAFVVGPGKCPELS